MECLKCGSQIQENQVFCLNCLKSAATAPVRSDIHVVLPRHRDPSSRPVLPVGQQLLEVKYDEYLPDFIYRSLMLPNLRQTAFSKYYICRKYTR